MTITEFINDPRFTELAKAHSECDPIEMLSAAAATKAFKPEDLDEARKLVLEHASSTYEASPRPLVLVLPSDAPTREDLRPTIP